MKKLLRKIGGGVKKVVSVVAKPFKKIMGFMGRLGWVGTLAMMFAMPYLSSFWGSMTEGMSSFIGGTGAGGSTAAQASAQTVAKETAKGVAKDVAVKAGAEAGKATIKGALKSSFASGTGQATGLFAGNAASKALGYTLKSFQVAASGISNAYSTLTELITGGIDYVTNGGLTKFDTWVGDRFNEARSAMGMKTSEGWTAGASATKPSIDAKANVQTGDVVKPITTVTDESLKASSTVDAGTLTEQALEKANIGSLKDATQDDFLKTQRSLLDADSSVVRQTPENMQLVSDDGTLVDIYGKPVIDLTTIDDSLLAAKKDEWYFGKNIKEGAKEMWKGRYEPQPVYETKPDGSYVLDTEGNLAPPIGQKDVFQPGLQDYVRNPEKILEKGFDYSVSSAREFLNPQRVIQKEIDEITGLNPQAQVTYIENLKTIAPIAPLSPNTGILPDLPGLALSAANHMNNVNNNQWYTSASMFDQEDDYTAPGYVLG